MTAKKIQQRLFIQSGQASRIIIILAVVLLLAGVLVYFGIKYAKSGKNPTSVNSQETTEPSPPPVPKPVYEVQMGDIKIILLGAYDLGNALYDSRSGYHQDVFTTDRFIMVTVQAQNKGKVDTQANMWSLGAMIDSEQRVFNQIGDRAAFFIPLPDMCGALLKPEFEPSRCTKIFEVSKVSKGLKVQVNGPMEKGKTDPVYIDLNI